MMAQATCKFCALTDDTIQVICESRCLICSRCQQVPILRKLLIDHTMAIDVCSTATQPARTYLKGFCPVCESSMSTTMLSLISTYKELYKAAEDSNSGRPTAGMELEETSTLIPAFVKRYKTTYECEEKRFKASAPTEAPRSTANEVYDLTSAQPPRVVSNTNAVMEFIVDCYTAMWQNILRNGRDSMLTTTFRMFSRKRFSQRTNDMRARAILDFLAGSTGSETADFLLFGRLLGLQPRHTSAPRPAWGVIATSVIAAGFCDRCLKSGHINDLMGNPNVSEFRQKVSKMAGPPDAKNYPAKVISLRKAIKIVELLSKVKQPYWVMSPIIPQCVEFASKLPWDAPSIAKLLNILIFVSMSEDVRVTSSSASPVHSRGSILIPGAGTRSSTSLPAIGGPGHHGHPGGLHHGNRAASVSFSLSPDQSTATLAATAAAFSAAGSATATMASVGPSGNRRRTSTADLSEQLAFGSSKIVMLRNLETLVGKVWRSGMNKNLSFPPASKEGKLFFIGSLDKHRYHSYVQMDFDAAFALAESHHTILLSELAYVLIHCWDAEFSTIKQMLSRGQTTFSRRPGILGFYDTSKARMNGVERLCLIRLLHWYSTEDTFLGIDWDDVEEKAKDRLFPFAIPPSLLQKSHNELNHLAHMLVDELKQQKLKDEAEDAVLAETGSIAAAFRAVEEAREQLATAERQEEELRTLEQIERYNREQFLASQTLGYVDHFLLNNQGELELEMESLALQRPPLPRDDSFNMGGLSTGTPSRPSSRHRRGDGATGSDKAFLTTDPSQDALELAQDLDRVRIAAGLPTTSDLVADGTGSYSAFATMAYTAETADAQLAATQAGHYGDRTLGGLARPLSPPQVKKVLSRSGLRSPSSSEYTPAGPTRAPSVMEEPRPTSAEQPELTEGLYITRRILTPLEQEVRKMVIRDPTWTTTGQGITSTPLKLKRVEVENPYGERDYSLGDGGSVSDISSVQPAPAQAGNAGMKLRFALGMHDEEQLDANAQYIQVREANRKSRLLAAQGRIQDRVAAKERQEQEQNTAAALAAGMVNPTSLMVKPPLTRMTSQKAKITVRSLPVLNFNQYVGDFGELKIELSTHLSAESAVKVFTFKRKQVSLQTFQEIVNHYFKQWHFDHLIRIDIVGINIGPFGARMLSEKFGIAQVHLVHLNLTGCQIGGQGMRAVLEKLAGSGATQSLLRLDLQDNNISLASDSFAYVGQFTKLRVLDVSRNCFTLDTPSQQRIFRDGLSPLTALQTLSVAHNKIMDRGCKQVCTIVKERMPHLQILDLAACFLTKLSLPILEDLLEHSAPELPPVGEQERRDSLDEPLFHLPEVIVELEPTANPLLRELLVQDNMFNHAQYAEYCTEHPVSVLNRSKCKLNVNSSRYIGVEFPLGYSLHDYGVEEYLL